MELPVGGAFGALKMQGYPRMSNHLFPLLFPTLAEKQRVELVVIWEGWVRQATREDYWFESFVDVEDPS